jgi:predicted ATPase
MSDDGRIKVLDFGLAKWMNRPQVANSSEAETAAYTREGIVLGTVPYMSPEQASGAVVDSRSDIFSFGTVLYQLASGDLPFKGPSSAHILTEILRGNPAQLQTSSPKLNQIIKRCLDKDPANRYPSMSQLLADLSALKTSGPIAEQSPKHNLPIAVTKFVGRERELNDLTELISAHRLITITGAGGSGKTRLAFETGIKNINKFSGGVWQIDLAPVTPELVVKSFVSALDVTEQADQSLLQSLADHLKDRQVLLIVDNCEHVLAEVANAIETILQNTPHVQILATSREALNLAGEFIWTVPPLSLPSMRGTITKESAISCDAVKLFVDRATARDSRFALTDVNVESIVSICTRLDGIPLAIELAAARIKVMSASEIRKRLDDCFRFLTVGTRGSLPRHQTLRAAVDWSYDLLTTEEQMLFRRLAIFRGGFDLDAIENICGNPPLEPDGSLDQLTRLIDKSLVLSDRSASDVVRYRILEPLRQYAMEKLTESGEAKSIEANHLRHYTTVSEHAYQERIEKEAAWMEHLERDHDNLRAALTWASDHDPAGALQLAGALGWFWVLHSHFSEGRRWLRHVLAGQRPRSRESARALCAASALAAFQGDHMESEPAEEGLAIWRELGDKRETALALDSMGWRLWIVGDNEAALKTFEEALSILHGLGDELVVNRITLGICQVLISQFDVDRVQPMAEKCLPIALKYDVPRDIHFAYHFLADCALIRGDVNTSLKTYVDSLRAAVRLGDRFEIAYEIEGIAMSLAGLGQDSKSIRLEAAVRAEHESLHTSVSIPFWEQLKQRYLLPAEQRSGSDAAAEEKQIGRSMGFESAIDYALKHS